MKTETKEIPIAPSTLRAFHGDKTIQEKYLTRMDRHAEADQIVQGATGRDGRGCAVWCTFDQYEHELGEKEIGFPYALMLLDDRIFEGLTVEESVSWPGRFLRAPRLGADLTLVPHQFAIWLLTSPDSLYTKALADESDKKIVAEVAELYRRYAAGDTPTDEEWMATERKASEASQKAWDSYYAARALARARALDRARDLARDHALDLDRARALALALARARALARDHALDLARDLALDLARDLALDLPKFFTRQGEKLLQLMAEAPVCQRLEAGEKL